MTSPVTIHIPGNAFPMTKPKANFRWEEGQETRPFVTWTWPKTFETWKEEARVAAKVAMQGRGELIQGYVAIGITFAFARPTDHYRSNGDVKDKFLRCLPEYKEVFIGDLHRGAVDACYRTVFPSMAMIAFYDRARMVWRPSGYTEITVRSIAPEEVDEEIANLPPKQEQGELEL